MTRRHEEAVQGATRSGGLPTAGCRVAPRDAINTRTTKAVCGYLLALSSADSNRGLGGIRSARAGSRAPPCMRCPRPARMMITRLSRRRIAREGRGTLPSGLFRKF